MNDAPRLDPLVVELPLAAGESRGWVDLPFPMPARLTLRSAGDMRDRSLRTRLLRAMRVAPQRVCMVNQVHSRTVVDADELLAAGSTAAMERSDLVEADGIVSGPDGPVLAVGVGDCAPLFLVDERTRAYALLHSGWRGTGILMHAVEILRKRYACEPSDLLLHVGPCISAASYDVDAARAAAYRQWGSAAVVHSGDTAYLDMRAANVAIADRVGIRAVSVANHCTYTTPQLGSFRREGTAGYTGMLALLGPISPRRLRRS